MTFSNNNSDHRRRAPATTLPEIPASMPRMGNRFSSALGRFLLRSFGWKIEGQVPDRRKLMVIAAPHTSNWDFVLASCVLLAVGLRVRVMMKKEAFIWPLGGLFKALGFLPVDRQNAGSVVDQAVHWYAQSDKFWMVVTPEGTRSKVERWKTGFLRIAQEAGVDVLLVGIHFPEKTFKLVPELFTPSGDHSADIEKIQAFYQQNFVGKVPARQ